MDAYATHLPVLLSCIARTRGPVLELGCGDYSTWMLHYLLRERKLLSLENDKEWLEKFRAMESETHSLQFVEDWELWTPGKELWSVALVDHAPGDRRYLEVLKLKDTCEFIVAHDTQYHNYHRAFDEFKYKYEFKALVPETIVVSNFSECAP